MKQSPLQQLERLPANEMTLAQLEKMHSQLLRKEAGTRAADPVQFILVPSVWRSHWIPVEKE